MADLPLLRFVQKLDSLDSEKKRKLSDINSKLDELKSRTIGRIDQLDLPPELKSKLDGYTGAINQT